MPTKAKMPVIPAWMNTIADDALISTTEMAQIWGLKLPKSVHNAMVRGTIPHYSHLNHGKAQWVMRDVRRFVKQAVQTHKETLPHRQQNATNGL